MSLSAWDDQLTLGPRMVILRGRRATSARARSMLGGVPISAARASMMLDMGPHDVVEIARQRESQPVEENYGEHHGEEQKQKREPQAEGAP
jgi:hypothetical protein